MKVRFPGQECKTPEQREAIARFAAGTMGNNPRTFEPYKTNDADDSFWVIDEPNDWRIQFLGDDSFHLVHRYGCLWAVEALTKWLAYRLGGTLEE